MQVRILASIGAQDPLFATLGPVREGQVVEAGEEEAAELFRRKLGELVDESGADGQGATKPRRGRPPLNPEPQA